MTIQYYYLSEGKLHEFKRLEIPFGYQRDTICDQIAEVLKADKRYYLFYSKKPPLEPYIHYPLY